jgi:predicted small secreted protein
MNYCVFLDLHRFLLGEMKMFKSIFIPVLVISLLATTLVSLTACNTIAGAGKDVEQGGKAVKDEANEHK